MVGAFASRAGYWSTHNFAGFTIVSTACGESQPAYEGFCTVETTGDIFIDHRWQLYFQIDPPYALGAYTSSMRVTFLFFYSHGLEWLCLVMRRSCLMLEPLKNA
jgi:hypothetical protein